MRSNDLVLTRTFNSKSVIDVDGDAGRSEEIRCDLHGLGEPSCRQTAQKEPIRDEVCSSIPVEVGGDYRLGTVADPVIGGGGTE
jgi:hypothetical protein